MTPNLNRIEEEFKEAANSWDLGKLYIDLASAKGKALTPVEKRLLRGLLCGYSPAEIASTVYQSASSSTVRVYLSNGLYKYMEEVLGFQTGIPVKIQNWSRVTQLLEKAGYRNDLFERSPLPDDLTAPAPIHIPAVHSNSQGRDWGEAIDVSVFYGRTSELQLLEQWIVTERCRLVTLLGTAGIGKTALSVKVAKQIQAQFEFVIWRSLSHAPLIEVLLAQLLQVLSPQRDIHPFSTVTDGISQLIESLRSSRCLIVLDSAESILGSGDRALLFRPGYDGYGELLRRVGDAQHQSCFMLTSQEKQREMAAWQGATLPVRTLGLTGLTDMEGWEILEAKGLSAPEAEWRSLVQYYAGNPLFIKIVATTIQDLFDGSISKFLEQDTIVFGHIREILDRQFERLSDLEKQILCWLLLNRDSVSLQRLQKEISISGSQREILEAVEALQGRSFIEKSLSFCQAPVLSEYISEQLIEQIHKKLGNKEVALFMESQLRNYVRERRSGK